MIGLEYISLVVIIYFFIGVIAAVFGWAKGGGSEKGFRAAYFWVGSVAGTTMVLVLWLFDMISACAGSGTNGDGEQFLTKNDCDDALWAWYILVKQAQQSIGIAFTFLAGVWAALVGYSVSLSKDKAKAGNLVAKLETLEKSIESIKQQEGLAELLKQQVEELRKLTQPPQTQ